jgi:hypothetical protein
MPDLRAPRGCDIRFLTTTGKLVNDGETKVIEHREDFDLTKQPPTTTT